MGQLSQSLILITGVTFCLLGCQENTDGESDSDSAMMADAGVTDASMSDAHLPDAAPLLDSGEPVEPDAAPGPADASTKMDMANAPDSQTADMGTSTESLTWADCRIAFLNASLNAEQLAQCDDRYRTPAADMRYGIHWVFLGHDQATVDGYPDTQLGDLNAAFAASSMHFFSVSRTRIIDPVVTEGGRGTRQYTLRDVIPDLRQHLGLGDHDPEAVLAAFIERQRTLGVTGERAGLSPRAPTLNTRWNSATFYRHIARLHPEQITVIVRNAAGEKSTGSYPSRNFSGPTADVVFLTEAGALSALPHEVGHFFGLVHTHGVWSRQPGATQLFPLSQLDGISDDDWVNLQRVAGMTYESDFRDTYLAYDVDIDELREFESAQIFGRKVLGWSDFTYTGDFEPVANDGAFIALLRAETPPRMKNFVRANEQGSFTGNNCGKSYVGEDRRTLRCKYGDDGSDPQHLLFANDLIVGQTLLFGDDSTESNLMSYISTYIDDGIRRKIHLTERQRALIRFGAAMPSRQRLRNYAWDTQ